MRQISRSTLYTIITILSVVLLVLVIACGIIVSRNNRTENDPTTITTDASTGTTDASTAATDATNPGGSTKPNNNNGGNNGGNTGNNDSGNTGNNDSGNTGNNDSGNTGNNDSGNTGNNDSGNTGNNDSGNTGGNTGTNTGTGTISWKTGYIASPNANVVYYRADGTSVGKINRGTQVEYLSGTSSIYQIRYNGVSAHLEKGASVVASLDNVVPQHTKYIKTAVNLRDVDGRLLAPLADKGDDLTVTGYDYLNDDGSVHMYQVNLDGEAGYVMPWYVVNTEAEALVNYDHNGCYVENHSQRGNRFGGGDAGSLDYFPREKAKYEDNVMPDEVRALYLVSWKVNQVDSFIELAKDSGINAFVVDIIDGNAIGYYSEVMAKYAPSCKNNASNSIATYKAAIQKIKDAGFYVIGRITAFSDSTFVTDNKDSNPDSVITGTNGKPLALSSTYWPSAYSRLAWQYKVDLAAEAVELMGFQEIQFDYVRFPDLTYTHEQNGTINYHNTYNETKAQAIQRFLMYATDILHEKGVYVSADVFGETCNNYVAAYGQYWPAISNVVDVISGMPYPDHWAIEGNFIPWENPYYTISRWGNTVAYRQNEIPTPAIVRTWIQAYDTNWKEPYVHYGPDEVAAQIQALRDTGCDGGFMTWNGSSVYNKYSELLPAFKPPEED